MDMEIFCSSIKRRYRERRLNCEKQWPPCRSDELVRLVLVERGKNEGYFSSTQRHTEDEAVRRTPLAYADFFKVNTGNQPVRRVLVEGDAGIGKTTFCESVSDEWARGKLFQEFELVLFLPLRMKTVASAVSLQMLLKVLHSNPRLCDTVARFIEEGEGQSVLVIADGWDELSESLQKTSFLYHLLFQQYPSMSVVVTSRPSASAPLHQLPQIDRFVEVSGFGKEHIVEYIHSEFVCDHKMALSLLEQLENNPLIESICSVPLNCAIICYLWRIHEEDFPTTMTELYTEVILNIVLRNITCKFHTYSSVLSLTNFDALPSDLQQSWWLLCECAFYALAKDQLFFSKLELASVLLKDQPVVSKELTHVGFAIDKKILYFGLLQSAESSSGSGCEVYFRFLHLTFQEYLAALHLARQSLDKQLQVFQLFKRAGHLRMVWRLFFGIRFQVLGKDSGAIDVEEIIECIIGKGMLHDRLFLCLCAFEAQSELVVSRVGKFLVNYPTLPSADEMIKFGHPSTTYDCAAVLYVMSNMHKCDCVKKLEEGAWKRHADVERRKHCEHYHQD